MQITHLKYYLQDMAQSHTQRHWKLIITTPWLEDSTDLSMTSGALHLPKKQATEGKGAEEHVCMPIGKADRPPMHSTSIRSCPKDPTALQSILTLACITPLPLQSEQ